MQVLKKERNQKGKIFPKAVCYIQRNTKNLLIKMKMFKCNCTKIPYINTETINLGILKDKNIKVRLFQLRTFR